MPPSCTRTGIAAFTESRSEVAVFICVTLSIESRVIACDVIVSVISPLLLLSLTSWLSTS